MSFQNKVVIVTGSSSGIGAATAKLFAKEGADVVITGRSEKNLAAVSKEIEKYGKKPLVIKADVSKDEEAKKIIDETISVYKKLDILVNNAGFGKFASILSSDVLEAYDDLMATNLRAAINLTSLAAPHLIKTKGNIVNNSGIAGKAILKVSGLMLYCVPKAGLDHFTRGAALELAAHGVRVNAVSPGPVATEANPNMRDFSKVMPLKQVAEPEEIANLILFLASDKAKGITGSDYVLDQGYLLSKPF